MAIDILNANAGVTGILPSNTDVPHLPESHTYVASDVENLLLDKSLTPHIERVENLDPNVLNTCLNNIFEKCSSIRDIDIRHFIREDLQPLLENKSLLKAYMDMMIEG
mgnify:CR=1 FL=1